MVPLLNVMVPVPAAAVREPPQLLLALGEPAIVIPVGKVSANPTPVRSIAFAFGLVSVNVRVDVPPTLIGLGENDLSIVGGWTTVSVAVLDGDPVPPSLEVMAPVWLL